MKNKGSITIYLSIIIVSVLLFICVISESARMNMVQMECEDFTHMAVNSILAGYGKQIYDDYGILLVWENQSVEEQLEKYIQANINLAGLSNRGTNFMNTSLTNVEICRQEYATDKEGEKFSEQIVSYMKYAGTIKAIDTLTDKFKRYKDKSEVGSNNKNVTDIVDNSSEELKEFVKNINDNITVLKNTDRLKGEVFIASQKLENLKKDISSGNNDSDKHAKLVKRFLRKYRKLITVLDMKAGSVDRTMILIKQYERKKELFLKENGYTSGAGDYIDEDLEKLENVKNTIQNMKKLAVSDFSNIDSNNISTVETALRYAVTVESVLQSLKKNEITEEDKKNQSIYESAKAFLSNGILSMVIDESSKVSNLSISSSNLPSNLPRGKNENSLLQNEKNKAAFAVYADMKFGNYTNSESNDVLKYGMEYIINGKDSDKKNLVSTVKKIAALRNALNIVYLITDSNKMSEIQTVSASAATSLGLPFLEPIIKAALIEAWALAESVSDIKSLLKGERIPIQKSDATWKTNLTNLVNSSQNTSKSNRGLDYRTYLEILIMIENNHNVVYRTMDLIQLNIQKKYNSEFLMAKSFQGLEVKAYFETAPLFTSMPWAIMMLSENSEAYEYSINYANKY